MDGLDLRLELLMATTLTQALELTLSPCTESVTKNLVHTLEEAAGYKILCHILDSTRLIIIHSDYISCNGKESGDLNFDLVP